MNDRRRHRVRLKDALGVSAVAGRHLARDVDASRHRRFARCIPVLADASKLKLAKDGEEVGEELAHVAGGVDALGDGAEDAIGGADAGEEVGRVLHRAADAIEAGDDQPLGLCLLDPGHRGDEARSVGLRPRLVEVFMPSGDRVPVGLGPGSHFLFLLAE